MVFERKVQPVPERAYLQKASSVKQSQGQGQRQTLRVIKDAMYDQESKYKQMLEAKDAEILRHQEMLLAQKERILEQEKLKQDPNVI